MSRTVLAALAAALLLVPAALAQNADGAANAAKPDLSWVETLPRQSGVVQLPNAGAQLDLAGNYDFFAAADAKRIVTELWGNPPDSADGVLGVIVPKGSDLRDGHTWGAVVTYDDVGYVSDKDASTTDYTKLLDQMRQGEDQDNADRAKDHLPAMHLVGWAQSPAYDAQRHLLVWARDISVADASVHTLNYDIRVLGRKGVLSINVVAAVPDLPQVNAAAASIGATAQFNPGQRYADYNSVTDKTAAFGIGGLIAAGAGAAVAQKLGLFAIILAFAKKGIVVILAGFAAAAAWFRKTFARFFGGGVKAAASAPADPPPSSAGTTQPAGPIGETPRFGRRPPTGGGDIVS